MHKSCAPIGFSCLVMLASCASDEASGVDAMALFGGAGFTTFDPLAGGCLDSANGVDCNTYAAKADVYLQAGRDRAGLGDGWYYFAVLDPGGQQAGFIDGAAQNLSDGDTGDAASNRTFHVSDHRIDVYAGSHPVAESESGETIIQLAPYDDSSNPGGIYLLAICRRGATRPWECRYDAFRIRPSCGTPADAAIPDAAPDASPYCAASAPGLVGVYRGTANITVFWSWPFAYEDPPSCSQLARRYTTSAVLDISGPPYAVSLTLGDSFPYMLNLDLATPRYPDLPVWEVTPTGVGLYDMWPCEGNFASDFYEPATVYIDPSTGTATFHAHCETAFLDSCSFSTNYATDWEMVLPLSCVKGQTVYVGGAAVTCDENGTITSSETCSSVPGPCVAPRPDLCDSGPVPFCTTLQSDHDNCGQCGHACTAQEDCEQGTCVAVCTGGATACPDAFSGTACENLMSSSENCGGCDRFCTVLETCSGGQCVGFCPPEAPDQCTTGYGQYPYCRDLWNDAANCGTCFHACAASQTCQAGTCVP
jgi:hypothetical protein